MELKFKYAIGCLVQWYEINIVEEYLQSVKNALDGVDNKNHVMIDFMFIIDQTLEEINEEAAERVLGKTPLGVIFRKYEAFCKELEDDGYLINYDFIFDRVYTIADYRREFNTKYCDAVDILIWGETDALTPKQTFIADMLHDNLTQQQIHKYLVTFSICKMWDETWKVLEHNDFTDKPFIEGDTENWWSLRYTMNIDEMNKINDAADQLDIRQLQSHKFNGCGLIIPSEIINGVNIPKTVFFVHEDSAFMIMTKRVLGDIPQFVIKNILIVHNRKHPKKRSYIKGEENIDPTNTGALRKVHSWYMPANQMCEQNYMNLFNPHYKAFTWDDVFKLKEEVNG